MKKYLLAPLMAAAVGLSACDDLLQETPRSFITIDNFYQTAPDARAALMAVYQQMVGNDAGSPANWRYTFIVDGMSDHSNAHALDQNPPAQQPGQITWGTTNSFLNSSWFTMYRMIYRANLVIERVADAPISEAERAQIVAEATFLRGWAYHHLERLYGGVPIMTEFEDHRDPAPFRAAREEVHAQAIADLTAAEAVLPLTRPASEWGRVTKGAARMALADRYIWNSSRYGSNEWQQASDWAKTVIDSGVYELLPDQLDVFLPNNKGNQEMIWAVVHTGAANRSSSSTQASHYPRETAPGGGFGVTSPTQWVWRSFHPDDYRLDTSFNWGFCNLTETVCFCSARDPECDNVLPYETFPWKFRMSDRSANQRGDVDHPMYRYAETLLFYAEAQNELGNQAEAIDYINMVRARARGGEGGVENRAEPADIPQGLSLAEVRDAIHWERHLELIWEQRRWWDLIRRDAQEPGTWAATLAANDPLATSTGPLQGREFRMIWPIPQEEMDLNPNLVQNPGY